MTTDAAHWMDKQTIEQYVRTEMYDDSTVISVITW